MRFSMVDKIIELTPGRHITAKVHLAEDAGFFRHHFPGFPVVPGVLLAEMMAQAAGKCLDAERKPRGKAMLTQIEKARFRKWMRPGETAMIEADIRTNRDRYATAVCGVEVSGATVATAELFFSFVTMDRFAADFRDEVLEAYWAEQT
jgi:3-hydroxyacyl-[acyl-carrier-protein] dehydratase